MTGPMELAPDGLAPTDTAGLSAWAEIDLDAIADNVAALREHAGGTPVMAVVKGDAYGHGPGWTEPLAAAGPLRAEGAVDVVATGTTPATAAKAGKHPTPTTTPPTRPTRQGRTRGTPSVTRQSPASQGRPEL